MAFPSLSTGAYGYPVREAAPLALRGVAAWLREHPGAFTEVRFVLFSAGDLEVYGEALEALSP